jgi:hypothetical protein
MFQPHVLLHSDDFGGVHLRTLEPAARWQNKGHEQSACRLQQGFP